MHQKESLNEEARNGKSGYRLEEDVAVNVITDMLEEFPFERDGIVQ